MWNFIKNLFTRKKVTIDILVKGCKGNLASLSFDIGKVVLYRKDEPGAMDYDKPQVYLDRGYADCSGYAVIWANCLWKLGHKAHIYSCRGKKNHAVVIFKRPEDRGYCYTSNDEFYKTNITDRDEALKFAYPADEYEIIV